MDNVLIRRDQFSQFWDHSEPGGRVRVDRRAAFDQKIHQVWITIVEHTETACPPLGSFVNVGARVQQNVDGRPIAPLHRSKQSMLTEAVVWQRFVDLRSQFWMAFQKFANPLRSLIANGSGQSFSRR